MSIEDHDNCPDGQDESDQGRYPSSEKLQEVQWRMVIHALQRVEWLLSSMKQHWDVIGNYMQHLQYGLKSLGMNLPDISSRKGSWTENIRAYVKDARRQCEHIRGPLQRYEDIPHGFREVDTVDWQTIEIELEMWPPHLRAEIRARIAHYVLNRMDNGMNHLGSIPDFARPVDRN